MRHHPRRLTTFACTAAVLVAAATITAQYSLTVNKDRLINAANEPQNWLLMNGDYGSQRYSRLTQINRRERQEHADGLGHGARRHAGRRPERARERNQPAHRQRLHVHAATGGRRIYRSTPRDPNRGKFAWVADPGVPHEGNTSRTRGIALWEDKVLANLPDGRVIAINRENGGIVWDKKIAGKNEFGNQERLERRTARRRRQGADPERRRRRRHCAAGSRRSTSTPATSCGAGIPCRSPASPAARPGRTITTPGKPAAAVSGKPARTDAAQNLYIFGTGNPVPIYDPQFRPGDNLYTNSVVALNVATGKMAWYFQYTPSDSWDYDEAGVFMLYDTTIGGRARKVVGHYARNGFFYTVDRTNGRFIAAEKYVNDLNWTKGIDQETGKPVDYNAKIDVQIYNPEARALRGDPKKRTCPTWHGGVAHQPMAYNPVKKIAYGVGTEGCFSQNGAAVGVLSKDGGIDNKASQQRQYSSDLYYGSLTAFDAVNHKVLAKAVTEIEIRSGALATAGGLVFTALQDGWVVAYNDETLEELWRFNVGTPLKGAPVTYSIGPKQYLAVQAGGRHLHPVNWDKLENSSFLFVFALN